MVTKQERKKIRQQIVYGLQDLNRYERNEDVHPRLCAGWWLGRGIGEIASIDAKSAPGTSEPHVLFEQLIEQPGFILTAHIGRQAAWHYIYRFCRSLEHPVSKRQAAEIANVVMELFLRRSACPPDWDDSDLEDGPGMGVNVPDNAEPFGGQLSDVQIAESFARHAEAYLATLETENQGERDVDEPIEQPQLTDNGFDLELFVLAANDVPRLRRLHHAGTLRRSCDRKDDERSFISHLWQMQGFVFACRLGRLALWVYLERLFAALHIDEPTRSSLRGVILEMVERREPLPDHWFDDCDEPQDAVMCEA